ncbi:hypothetical protein BIW11_04656, partial [Tropilaelaps mercedesae]
MVTRTQTSTCIGIGYGGRRSLGSYAHMYAAPPLVK